jgi:hypothetical protein
MLKFLIDILTAVGTIGVAVSAIWGDWLRAKLAPLSLALRLDPEPDPISFSSGAQGTGYHLKVINRRPWIPAQNCRVMLVGLSRRDPSGAFQPALLSFPLQFIWTPLEFTPVNITVLKEHIVDFAIINQGDNKFAPRLYVTPLNFRGYVGPNEAVRYQIQIEATNFVSETYVIEVAWDGMWNADPNAMKQHLPVRMLSR